MTAWRIDTIDARGGLAFASWRDDDLFDNRKANGDPPSFFVGPPDFRPEPLASRAIALGAGRGAFQTGLFVEGVEVSFPAPTDVVEFVRRAYLRSGGSDGADGGGGEGPLPRPGDPPDLPRSPDSIEKSGLRAEIFGAIKEFGEFALSLKPGNTKKFDKWPAPFDTTEQRASSPKSGGPAMLASAALTLIYEMLQRLPTANDPPGLMRWQRDARRLGALFARLDLWPLLFSESNQTSLVSLMRRLTQLRRLPALKVVSNWPKEEACRVLLLILFVDGPALDNGDEVKWFFYQSRRALYGESFHLTRYQDSLDPNSDLLRIPLPKDLEKFVGSGLKDGANLYHALTAFISSPTTALEQTKESRSLIDLVLFSSACIVGPDGGRPLSPSLDSSMFLRRRHGNTSAVQQAAVQGLADSAWCWLREHLPSVVFTPQVEKAIQSTAELRYPSALAPR
jgi:hypothetical protein